MIYDIGFLIFSFIYLPALIFKGKLHADFAERFGIYDKAKERALESGKDRIWIQAVSVGEVALCKNLIPILKERFPANDIVISTITKAGNDLAKKILTMLTNKKTREQMAKRSYKNARDYDINRSVDKLEGVYKEVIA